MRPNTAHKQSREAPETPPQTLKYRLGRFLAQLKGKRLLKYEFKDAGPTMRDAQGPRKVIQKYKKQYPKSTQLSVRVCDRMKTSFHGSKRLPDGSETVKNEAAKQRSRGCAILQGY